MGSVYGIDIAVPAHERSLAWRYRGAVTATVKIAPISAEEFEALLPLIAAYQRFYEVEEIDEERNRAFFQRFLAPATTASCSAPAAAASWSATPASTGTSAPWRRSRRC